MDKQTATWLIGTGGWEHEVYDEVLYPGRNLTSAEKLRYYARYFDTTEVRATFWDGFLSSVDARELVEAVDENRRFRFNVKIHSSFTHKRQISLEGVKALRGFAQEMFRADRLGSLLAQFPFSFTNTSPNRYHLLKLAEIFTGFPVHVEFRHDSWDNPSIASLLDDAQLLPVHSDFPRIHHVISGSAVQRASGHAYLRLHGRNERGWLVNEMDGRYDYLYNSRELKELVRRSLQLSSAKQVIVICNNTTGGKAVANALQLSAALRNARKIALPPQTLKAFPSLQEIGDAPDMESGLVFREDFRQAM